MKKEIAIGIIIGILISGIVAYAGSILSSDKVSYKDTTVKDSLDSLFNDSLTGKNNIISALSSKGFNVTENATYNQIVSSINELPIKLSKDEEGNYGYILNGSDTVNSFSSNLRYLGSTTNGVFTYSCVEIPGYQSLTTDDFIFIVTGIYFSNSAGGPWGNGEWTRNISTSYDSTTGELKVSLYEKKDTYYGVTRVNVVGDIYCLK